MIVGEIKRLFVRETMAYMKKRRTGLEGELECERGNPNVIVGS